MVLFKNAAAGAALLLLAISGRVARCVRGWARKSRYSAAPTAPLDKETILNSVAKTKYAIVLDEGPVTGGISAELAVLIQENLFSDLKGPVVRVAAQPSPPPHSSPLVDAMIPDVEQIIDAVMRLAEGEKISQITQL